MSKKSIVLVGAKALGDTPVQYGGVLTLSSGLVEFAGRSGYDVEIVNTLRPGFEHLPLWARAKAGLARGFQVVRLLASSKRSGVIIFAGAGFSFYERVLFSAICRIFRVPDAFFIVDGAFFGVRDQSALRRRLTGALLRIPSRLIASGSNWADLFRELSVPKDRVVVVHYWLPSGEGDVAKEPIAVPNEEPVRFLFVGWMITEKGIHEIISAMEALVPKHDFQFTFIGGGTLLDHVREAIRDNGWEQQVAVLGWVTAEEIARELSRSHVFVLPSYAEGFPMSLIEAMTKGVPAICTNVGGISDSLKDGTNGFLIPPKSAAALIETMKSYIRNPEQVAQHSAAALEIVRRNHDPDVNCQLLFDSLFRDR
jgi:glycosyltransferase involved in cell wall biosynthesis